MVASKALSAYKTKPKQEIGRICTTGSPKYNEFLAALSALCVTQRMAFNKILALITNLTHNRKVNNKTIIVIGKVKKYPGNT